MQSDVCLIKITVAAPVMNLYWQDLHQGDHSEVTAGLGESTR